MAKDTFYFSHDFNARTDDKIKNLIRKHGMRGYGIFWAIVEDLYNNANALRLDCEGIAYDLRADTETVESIIKDFDLFVFDGEYFGSRSIETRLNERNEKSRNAKESADRRWEKVRLQKEINANALRTQSEGNAINKGKETKESKEKEINKESEFEIFWNVYDKKVDSKKCKHKFIQLPDTDIEKILNTIHPYVRANPDRQFRKNPLTYLNGNCWNDEIIFKSPQNGTNNVTQKPIITEALLGRDRRKDEE